MQDNTYLKILEVLQQKHITQKQLAQKIKVKPSSLSRMLSGKYTLKLDTISKIAGALNISVENLLNNDNYSSQNSDDTAEIKRQLLRKTEENEMLKHQVEILKDTIKLLELKLKK